MAVRPSFSGTGPSILDAKAAPWDWKTASNNTGRMAMAASNASIDAQRKVLADAIAGGGSADAEMKANRQKITDLTEGRATDLQNDPRLNQAMDFFGGVVSGANVPFSQEVQHAQLNQQANATAAANAAQLRALEESIVANGGSINDPSFQAKKQELNSNRQGQNLDALGRMLSQAQVQNFNAQANGANALAGIRSGQNAQINNMNLAGANYRGMDFRDVPTGGQGGGGWGTSYTTTTQLGGGGSKAPAFDPTGYLNVPSYQAPAPVRQVAPQPAPAPQTHTLTTGRPWGPPGSGYAVDYNTGLSSINNMGPPVPQQPRTFGSAQYRPLGPGQI